MQDFIGNLIQLVDLTVKDKYKPSFLMLGHIYSWYYNHYYCTVMPTIIIVNLTYE